MELINLQTLEAHTLLSQETSFSIKKKHLYLAYLIKSRYSLSIVLKYIIHIKKRITITKKFHLTNYLRTGITTINSYLVSLIIITIVTI